MSHLIQMEVEVKDLDCLRKAGEALGLDLTEASTYRWYGRSVGDYPLPAEIISEDLGKCSYKMSVRGLPGAYEIGVVQREGKYILLWDFWRGGYGLQERIGVGGTKLVDRYSAEVVKKDYSRRGYRVTEKTAADGTILLQAVR
jgi:hypothetical protein